MLKVPAESERNETEERRRSGQESVLATLAHRSHGREKAARPSYPDPPVADEKDEPVAIANRFCEIRVDTATGAWSGIDRSTGSWGFRDARFRLDQAPGQPWREPMTEITWSRSRVDSCFGNGTELLITFSPREGYAPVRMLRIRLYPEQPFIEVGWGVRNPFAHPIRVRRAQVLDGGELFHGQRMARPRVLKSGAGAEPNPVTKGWELEAFNGALLTYKDHGVRRSLVAGGLAYCEFARVVDFRDGYRTGGRRAREKGYRNMNLAFWDPCGKLIGPGVTYSSEDTCYLDIVTADPFEALENYGHALRLANDADPNGYDFPTLCGWMVSTKSLGEGKPINNSVGLVEQTRMARERGLMEYTPLAVRLEPDTYCYGNFGDTQQGWWDDEHWSNYGPGNGKAIGPGNGSLREPYETVAKFCRAVSELGGIPFTYFQCSMPSNDFAAAHPDWMLSKDISLLHHTHAHHRPLVRYDYSHPGFRAHCLAAWKRLREAGLRGVKFDYPETAWAPQGGFDDARFTTTSAYRELFRLCREGLGEDAFIHERILGGATHEDAPRLDTTAGIVDLQRVWGDASHFEPEMASRMGLRWYKSRGVFLYYPDGKSFFRDGKELPAHERRAFLTIIAFLSGRLEIGTSIGSMTDEMLHDMTRVFPMLTGSKSPRPVDMLTGVEHPAVYVYRVDDSWSQVLLLNNGKRRRTISAPMAGDQAETGSLGLDETGHYHAFDFWGQHHLGVLDGRDRLSLELRAGEAAMISVRRLQSNPQLVSTNRHIMQGLMECHGVTWSPVERTLSGEVDVIAGEAFILTVACNGWEVAECKGAKIHHTRGDLVDLVIQSQENARKPFRLRFQCKPNGQSGKE